VNEHTVAIVSTGARTPVGLTAAPSAAAWRAGISAAGAHPFMIDRLGDPMPGALDELLDPTLMGPERLVEIAASAMREVCEPLRNASRSPVSLPLYLALPELRPGFSEREADEVRDRLAQSDLPMVSFTETAAVPGGHAAGIAALVSASDRIRRGELETCLVGGVESYFHPDTMEWLDSFRQLAGADARSAFVPGEAAGFCLLMSERARERAGLQALAEVGDGGLGREAILLKTPDVCLGEGLTAAVRGALRNLAGRGTVNSVICDINGERYRADEWAFVCLRLPELFDDPTSYWCPAEAWGDVGAASGALFAMLACEAAARGYGPGPNTLLWASSEGGLRAAVVIHTASVA
jgi:3-oxoacyl-[acyl-carrier-protein] synthase I